MEKLLIEILSITDSGIGCCASNISEAVGFIYSPSRGTLEFVRKSDLSELICRYQFQFEKIIRSAIKGTLIIGQKISCVFIDGFNFLTEADYNRFSVWTEGTGS